MEWIKYNSETAPMDKEVLILCTDYWYPGKFHKEFGYDRVDVHTDTNVDNDREVTHYMEIKLP